MKSECYDLRSIHFSAKTTQPSSSGQIRRQNCRHLFDLIRTHQPLSRSDLSRLTGMPKATVFPIVKEIVRAGWVEEGRAVKIPRGRSPIMLRPSRNLLAYAVALEERKAHLGLVSLEGYIQEQYSIALPHDPKLATHLVTDELQSLVRSRTARIVCGGICTTVTRYPKAQAEKLFDTIEAAQMIAEHLQSVLKVPVEIGSSLHGTMLHEMTSRSLPQVRSAVLLHISHDVAGAIWANGELLSDDIGHFCVDPNGPICHCGNYGCWSFCASDDAAMAAFHGRARQARPQRIEELYQLFTDGEPAAIEAVKVQEEGIASGIRTLARILEPDLIIIQGACVGIWEHLSTRVKKEMEEIFGTRKSVHLISVQCGEFDQLRAAAALGWLAIDIVAHHHPA